MRWLISSLLILTLLTTSAVSGGQQEQLEYMLALLQHRPGCDVSTPKAKPPVTSTSHPKGIDWLPVWQKVPGQTAFVKFSADWCGPCVKMKPLWETPQVANALASFTCYHPHETKAERWGVEDFPTFFIVGPKGQILRKHVGGMTLQELLDFINPPEKDAYFYPQRPITWTLKGRWVSPPHLTDHYMHKDDGLDPYWVKELDLREVQSVHQDAHNHCIDWSYAQRRE